MNRVQALALLVATLLVAACGGGSPPPATGGVTPEPATSAATAASAPAASASSAVEAPPVPASAAVAAAPPPASAADAAAACSTTATYDKKEPKKVTFSIKNTSNREVKMCFLEFYFYDKAGKQLAHLLLPYNYAIAPGASDGQGFEFADLALQIGKQHVATVETVISAAKFSDGSAFEDKSLAPDVRPKGGKK